MSGPLTAKQREANRLLSSDRTHVLLYGGARSGKTFLILRAMALRALHAPGSRQAVLRHRFNHLKIAILYDTWPKMMRLCLPEASWRLDKTDWIVRFPNEASIVFGGLDDRERTEKILGQEYAGLFLNEVSQIGIYSRNIALTRLAQLVAKSDGTPLRLRMFYDCNPPSQAHWIYKLFFRHEDPLTRQPIADADDYAAMRMNPTDNQDNLPPDYLARLRALPVRMRKRFLEGEFVAADESALWTLDVIERHRVMDPDLVPDLTRIVIGVDPSGAHSTDEMSADEIGIVAVGLGTDGDLYVIDDSSLRASPAQWGRVVATAHKRLQADRVVGEENYGGAMVEHVLRTAYRDLPYRSVHATRGKWVRAEPVSALYEQGRIHHVGEFAQLEDELCSFTTTGYTGSGSPNRADALIWAVYDLVPELGSAASEPRVRVVGA